MKFDYSFIILRCILLQNPGHRTNNSNQPLTCVTPFAKKSKSRCHATADSSTVLPTKISSIFQELLCILKVGTNTAYMTSQNHGFAVNGNSISDEWKEYFVNLNDYSNEGIIHKTKPFFSTQFHPEASSGPTDTAFLFDNFIDSVIQYKETSLTK